MFRDPADEYGQMFALIGLRDVQRLTGVAAADPFVVIADGRCPFTARGLLALADLIDRLRALPASGEDVRQITP